MRPYQPGQDFYNLIETAIPETIRAEYPMLVDFLKVFLTYLEQERTFTEKTVNSEYGSLANNQVLTTVAPGGVSYEMRKFLEYRDISTTIDDFVPYFLQMFAKNWPQHTFVSADQFISTLRYFYTHKSLEETVEWFFRALFNEQAALYYPRVDILKASDGSWYVETSIKVGAPTNGFINEDVAKYYIGQIIQTATGQAQVDRIRTTVVGQSFGAYLFVNELILIPETVVGSFAAGQDVHNINGNTVVHTNIIPVIVGVNILEGGAAYVVGDLVTFSEGPGLGEGFGAAGIVSSVGSAPLNGVTINDGGDGFVIGDPVVFISSSGHGAEAFVDQVIAGNFLLEAEDGFILGETRITGDKQYLAQEDHNFITRDLSIEPFVTISLQLGASDYGAAGQPAWNINTILDYVFAASGSVPFMHPWAFRDFSGNTSNVTLANTMLVANLTSLAAFANNDANVFVIASPTDTSTNAVSASIFGRVILSDISTGLNRNRLFVTNTSLGFVTGQTVKFDGSNKLATGTLTCNTGSANVVGHSTSFQVEVSVNTQIKVGADTYAVRSITNSTFLTLYSLPVANASNSAFDIVPTGTILSVTDQSQRIYGKIRHIAFVAPGSGYIAPPLVTVNSISALAQQVYYYDPIANTFDQSNGTVDIFRSANLTAQQSAGQITRIDMTDSGVYYTDANAVIVTALHSQNVPEARFATLTANIGLGSLTSKSGSFRDTKGFLSSDKFLQDGEYYNDHTYVVRVAESFDRWEAFYKKIIHPAGFKVLGEFVLSVQADQGLTLTLEDPEDALVIIGTEPPVAVNSALFMIVAGNGEISTSNDSGNTWTIPSVTDASPTATSLPATMFGGTGGGGAGSLNYGTQPALIVANVAYFPVNDRFGNFGIRSLANVANTLVSTLFYDFGTLGIYISGSPAPVDNIDSLVTDGTTIFAKCEVANRIFIIKIPIANPSSATLWASGSLTFGSITNGSVDADYTNLGYVGPITGPLVIWDSKLVMTRSDASGFSGIIYKPIAATGAWTTESPWTNYPSVRDISGGDPNLLWITVKEGSTSTSNVSLWSRSTANTWTKVQTFEDIDEDVSTAPMIIWSADGQILLATFDSFSPGNRHWMYSSNSGATFTETGIAYDTWDDIWYNYNAFGLTPIDVDVFFIAEAVGTMIGPDVSTKVKLSRFDSSDGTMTEITLSPDILLWPGVDPKAGWYRPLLGMIQTAP